MQALMAYDVGSVKINNLTFTGNGLTTPMATALLAALCS